MFDVDVELEEQSSIENLYNIRTDLDPEKHRNHLKGEDVVHDTRQQSQLPTVFTRCARGLWVIGKN